MVGVIEVRVVPFDRATEAYRGRQGCSPGCFPSSVEAPVARASAQ